MTAAEQLRELYVTEAEIAKLLNIKVSTLRNRKYAGSPDYPPIDSDGLCHIDDFKAWQKKRAARGRSR